MKTKEQIMQEIIDIRVNIQSNYPELYRYLNETPLRFNRSDEALFNVSDLLRYLETLKSQLKHHIESESKK